MAKRQDFKSTIAIVGGDGRAHALQVDAEVQTYPSSRNGGNGKIRDVIAAIKHGKIQLVVVQVRWIGHSECDSIVKACKAAQVPVVVIARGSVVAREQQIRNSLEGRAYRLSA